MVIAEESRSQHENRARALKRLRCAFFLELRDALAPGALECDGMSWRPEVRVARRADGRIALRPRDRHYWPVVGIVLDVLAAAGARVSVTAEALAITTGNLIEVLRADPRVWQQANRLRARFGQKPLIN
jgi:hypothetical protein